MHNSGHSRVMVGKRRGALSGTHWGLQCTLTANRSRHRTLAWTTRRNQTTQQELQEQKSGRDCRQSLFWCRSPSYTLYRRSRSCLCRFVGCSRPVDILLCYLRSFCRARTQRRRCRTRCTTPRTLLQTCVGVSECSSRRRTLPRCTCTPPPPPQGQEQGWLVLVQCSGSLQ